MRIIKFRGKSICDDIITTRDSKIGKGDWVYGSLIMDNQPYIVGEIADVDSEFIAPEFWIPVDKDTIGQFTGLLDKNGVEIYEGDKIYIEQTKEITTVSFLDGMAMFIFNVNGGEIYDMDDILRYDYTIEIIGNIHEEVEK